MFSFNSRPSANWFPIAKTWFQLPSLIKTNNNFKFLIIKTYLINLNIIFFFYKYNQHNIIYDNICIYIEYMYI